MSSIDTIDLNCLVFLENGVFLHFGDIQTDKQMNSSDALSRSRYRERRLNNDDDDDDDVQCEYHDIS